MSDKLNIHQKINLIMKEVSFVQKDAVLKGYKAVTHDQVTSAVRPRLVEHGVTMSVSLIQSDYRGTGNKTSSGREFCMYTGRYEVSFINTENSDDKLVITVEGQGEDMNDKGPGKAISYATKYAILKTFLLETGENDESRNGELKAHGEQIRLMSDKAKQLDIDYKLLCKGFGKESVIELSYEEADRVLTMLSRLNALKPSIDEIKSAHEKGDFPYLWSVFDELSDAEKQLLIYAPTKGGPLTSKIITKINELRTENFNNIKHKFDGD